VTLVRSANDLFNDMMLLPGTLTNAAVQPFPYATEDIKRDQNLKTNYFGYLDFKDGDPSTSTPDFLTWVFSIYDPNDANGNGIPDLSDNPGPSAGGQAILALSRSANQLLLSITATAGKSYSIEEATALGQTNWLKSTTITLTNSPQVVALPLPITPVRFWRLRSL